MALAVLGLACAKPDADFQAVRQSVAAMTSDRLDGLPADLTWSRLQQGVYVNYVGVPPEGSARPRWLVLIISPEAGAAAQKPQPNDDEHQTLPDGTLLHVSVWSQPNAGPVPVVPVPFPEVDGWTQRRSR